MASSWMENKRVLVAMPALNEQASVGDVVRRVRVLFPNVDVLLVDDGSSDNTSRTAAHAGAMVCRLPFNLGVGAAMRTAYKYAHRAGYDVVVQIDADGQHDPASLETLVNQLAFADLVVGARFAGVGSYPVALPRRAAMRFLSGTLTRLAGEKFDRRYQWLSCGWTASHRALRRPLSCRVLRRHSGVAGHRDPNRTQSRATARRDAAPPDGQSLAVRVSKHSHTWFGRWLHWCWHSSVSGPSRRRQQLHSRPCPEIAP